MSPEEQRGGQERQHVVPAWRSLVSGMRRPGERARRCVPCRVEADAHPRPHRTRGKALPEGRQENTRSGKHGKQAFEDGRGWESWFRVCLQRRPLRRGWTWAGWKARQWGFSRRPGSTAKPAQHTCSLLPWRACSREGLSLLHPQPGSNFPAGVPSPDKSCHLEGVEAVPQRHSGRVLWAASRGGRLPGSAQTPLVPRSSDGRRYMFISSAVSRHKDAGPLEEALGISSTQGQGGFARPHGG